MSVQNLNLAIGLCNGTRIMIKTIKKYVIESNVLSGPLKGQTIFMPRISLYPDKDESPFIFKIRQFLIKLAFFVTINKSQEQTIQKCGIYIETPLLPWSFVHCYVNIFCTNSLLQTRV